MVVGLVAVLVTAPLGNPVLVAICIIPIGAGGALAMPSVTGVVLEGVPGHQAGTASAVFNTFRQVGGAVAIAVFGALIADPDPGRGRAAAQPGHRRHPAAARRSEQPPHPTPHRHHDLT